MNRRWLLLDAAVKVALVALLVIGAVSGLPQFQGKAMAARAALFWIPAAVVPVVWWVCFRRTRYPWALDVLIVLPFLIDAGGNAANPYDTISWWDDANHLVNWALLTAGLGQLLLRLRGPVWAVFGVAVGFGAATAIVWELGEYVTFIRGNESELRTAYTDTLGDLGLGLTGAVVAATLTAWAPSRPTRARAPAPAA